MVTMLEHYCMAQNLGRFGTARKLVEKILAADHTKNSSLFELTTFGGLILWWITIYLPKFYAVQC